jgi:MFS family permease
MSVRFRLGFMMFLEYAIWGSWYSVLSAYLQSTMHFSGTQVGFIYSLLPIATIIAPMIGGQLADRYFPTQKVIAVTQLVGGAILLLGAAVTSYGAMVWLMLVYCIVYAPTLALTNSIAFINLKDSSKDFGRVRVWGTIGWIAAGWALAGWRLLAKSAPGMAIKGDMLFLAGIFSVIMGVASFGLPHTPPKREGTKPWAFLEAFRMLRDRDFLILNPDGAVPDLPGDRGEQHLGLARHDHRPVRGDLRHGAAAARGPAQIRHQADHDARRPGLAPALHHLRHRDAGLARDRLAGAPRLLLCLFLHGRIHLC